MIPMSLAEVARAVGGRLVDADGSQMIDEVSTDSRQVQPGSVFVAIVGENHDGHDHVGSALAAGARAALVSREVPGPRIEVDDTVAAAGRLAREVIASLPDMSVVALTGSSGKTSTKDLLRVILSSVAPTVAPQGSFNNELGLPRTVFEADGSTRYLVAEMGARGRGHIDYLCQIAAPDVAMVLNVGHAHVGEFGSQEAIAEAKSEIVRALAPEGVAVLNADDPLVAAMARQTPARVVTFGRSPEADVRIAELVLSQGRPVTTLEYGGQQAVVTPEVHGEHQALNMAAAVAAAVALGLPFETSAMALQGVRLDSRWRMEVTVTDDGITIINDAYNANPESMTAGLRSLAQMAGGARSWAVLGEMRELGAESARAHDDIGRLCVRLNISRLIAVGPGARAIHMGAAHEGSWGEESMYVEDVDGAIAVLTEQVQTGDFVLVKASRAVGLERVAQALMERR